MAACLDRWYRKCSFGLAVVTTAACGSGAPVNESVSSRDSAGVRIVTIAQPNWEGRVWRTAGVAEVAIGLESGVKEYLLDRVRGAVTLSDGRIVVADGGSKELRFFDPAGGFVSQAGREGEGPGEFAHFDFLSSVHGDSILVFDRSLQRATLLDSSGAYSGSWNLGVTGAPVFQSAAGATRQGDLVTFAPIGSEPEVEGPYTVPMIVGLVDRTNREFRLIDTIRSSEEARVERNGGLTRAFRPFGRNSDVAVSPEFVFVLDATAVRSVNVYSSDGELVRIFRFDVARVPATRDRVAAWRASFIARYSEGSIPLREFWDYGFDRTPSVDSIPLFRSLEVDGHGDLCLERHALTETAARVYWCFSHDGEPTRRVIVDGGVSQSVHPQLTPQLEIGDDFVLGVWLDALGVEQVRLYRLVSDTPD